MSNQGTLVFPPGLDTVSVYIKVPSSEFDFSGSLKAFGARPEFAIRADGAAVRGVVAGAHTLHSGHAHLEIKKGGTRNQTTIEVELVSGSHGKLPRNAVTFEGAMSMLRSYLKAPAKARRAMISANFTFSLNEWEPTIPLPFSRGAMVGDLPGVPQICGLDFAFTNRSEEQLLLRAFVTTYDVVDQMIVRFLLGHTESLSADLAERLLALVSSQIPIFARKRSASVGDKGAD